MTVTQMINVRVLSVSQLLHGYHFLLTLTNFLTRVMFCLILLHLLSSVSTVAVVPLVHAPVISICFDLKEI